jgi:hypothetical protein
MPYGNIQKLFSGKIPYAINSKAFCDGGWGRREMQGFRGVPYTAKFLTKRRRKNGGFISFHERKSEKKVL